MNTEKSVVQTIIERRDESQKWIKANYLEEWQDAYRAVKVRTKPVYRRDEAGNETKEEDLSRTNIAMPTMSLIVRKTTNRLTANPVKINYRGGSNPEITDKLTALSYQQFDRSGERTENRRVVQTAKTFGIGISKLSWDTVEIDRAFRKKLPDFTDRAAIMQEQGASFDEINSAVEQNGPQMTDPEMSQVMQQYGDEMKIRQLIKKYEGPVLKNVFLGDFSWEPGVLDLDSSGYCIEDYTQTDLWLKKQLKKTYIDDDGQEVPVFDPKACRDVLDVTWSDSDQKINDLRQAFRDVTATTAPKIPHRLIPGKRFDVLECHEIGDDGKMWISWVNEKIEQPLGRMPYPWDLYGKYCYTALVPNPDLLSLVGDCSPRLLRYLHALHNATVGQRNDLVRNILRPMYKQKDTMDMPNEVLERTAFRVIRVKDMAGFEQMQEAPVPQAAWETEAQLMSMMSLAEPSLNTTATGSQANPMAGKTATTAMLAAKSADVLTQGEVEEVESYQREIAEKKLWMNQQAATDKWQIGGQYPKTQLLSDRYGKTAVMDLDPHEIQEDYEIEPEAGSILAVDDDIRRASVVELEQMAMARPDIFNVPEIAKLHLSTIRGIGDTSKYLAPPPQGPPQPEIRGSFTVPIPFISLPSDLQNQFLVKLGFQPSKELELRDTMQGLQTMSAAADAAVNLHSEANPAPQLDAKGNPVAATT